MDSKEDANLMACCMVAHRMLHEYKTVRELHPASPEFFFESWIKCHIVGADDKFNDSVFTIAMNTLNEINLKENRNDRSS